MKPMQIIASLLMVLCCPPMALALTGPQQEQLASGAVAIHTVRPGDSFDKIARSNGCTIAELAAANGLQLDAVLQLGQQLKLPITATPNTEPSATPNQTTDDPVFVNGPSHTIQAGETFAKIAKQYEVSIDSLITANPTVKPTALRLGQKILLPASSKTSVQNMPEETHDTARNTDTKADEEQNTPPSASDAMNENSNGNPTLTQRTARTIATDREMTYGELAAQYGTETDRLNSLNGLDLQPSTVVVKGADLLVPVSVAH
jgi:LysM repeat protein